MIFERVIQRDGVVVRRMRLEPGEAMDWHIDPYHRVTVTLSGDRIGIEDRRTGEITPVELSPGMVGWDEPTDNVHRGVNIGKEPYEEIVVFFMDVDGADPQPAR